MSIGKIAFSLMAIAIVSKLAGFMREVLLAYFYGTSGTSDAYLISLTIPGTVYALVGAAISTALIPTYISIAKEDRINFVSNLTTIVFVISTVLILSTFIFAENIVNLVAPGFSGDTFNLTVFFTRIFVFGIYLSALINIYTGVLHAEGRMVTPALAGLIFSLVVAASIALSAKFGILILILGPLIAKLAEVLLMRPAIRDVGIKNKISFNPSDPNVRLVVIMTAPLALGISANEVNSIVSRALASNTDVGGVSALSYANQLNQLAVGVIGLSIATAIFPRLSKMFAEGKIELGQDILYSALRYTIFIVAPAAFFCAAFSKEIVTLVYGRGDFDGRAINLTSSALFFYSWGMLWIAMRESIARAFYALKDAKTPVNNAIFGVVINVLLSLLLAPEWGVGGLALATSISAAVTSSILLLKIRKRLGTSLEKGFWRDFLLVIAAGCIAVATVKISTPMILDISIPGVALLQSALFFSLIFLALSWVFRVDVARTSVMKIIDRTCKMAGSYK